MDIRYQYSETAPNYDKITRASGYDRVPPRLVSLFQQAAAFTLGMKVLDFGCGTGKLTQAMLDAGPTLEVTGMEPCHAMAKQFVERFHDNPHVGLINDGYRNQLCLKNESFDAVLSSGVFDHIKITPQVMEDFMRVIKPGGYLAFSYERHSRLFPFKRMPWCGGLTYSHSDSHVRHCLEAAGAQVLKHQRCFGYFYVHLARIGLFVVQKPG